MPVTDVELGTLEGLRLREEPAKGVAHVAALGDEVCHGFQHEEAHTGRWPPVFEARDGRISFHVRHGTAGRIRSSHRGRKL